MVLKLIILSALLPLNLGQDYKGESFPIKYLLAEDSVPETSDVDYYLQGLYKIIGYMEKYANSTDTNRAVGLFYTTCILKRTVKENKNKMQEIQLKLTNKVLLKADNVMSHYMYDFREDDWINTDKRIAELFKDQDLQIAAIGELNRNRLQKWLLKKTEINYLAKDMDELKLSRMDYFKLTGESIRNASYSIPIHVSDYCLGNIIYNPKPQDATEKFRPCVADKFCSLILYEHNNSISYTLSHRMFNLMFPRHVRRCYMRSIKEDDQLLDVLCSSMYRETVYLARLGYFYRDMWMEHIALCGVLGYEEFFRRHWFQKLMSWVDHQGCIAEDVNAVIRQSMTTVGEKKDPKSHEAERSMFKKELANPCHWHQMALGIIVLAHGVRHAVHYNEIDRVLKDEL